MANVEKLSLVALTRSTSNAGSGDVLNVTIDIDGNDVVARTSGRNAKRDKDLSTKLSTRLITSRQPTSPTLRFVWALEETTPGVRNTLCC
jgi:hypothetical protein